ncbi:hypothetical protein IWZ00DRAFT_489556 [Phyllosticta capitalensis]
MDMLPQAEGDTEIQWEVEGTPVVLGWRHGATGADQRLGRLYDTKEGGNRGTDLTLWIGHDTKDASRKVVSIRLPLIARSSSGKNSRDVFLVLPVSRVKLEVTDSVHDDANDVCSRFAFALEAAPYAIMPVPRRPMQKPLADSPGYLVQCLKSLTAVNNVDVHVAESCHGNTVLRSMVDAVRKGGSLLDVTFDLDKKDRFGNTRAIDCWNLYPVAADECDIARQWNPFIDKDPPAYSDCVAVTTEKVDALDDNQPRHTYISRISSSPSKDPPSPDEEITWHIPPTPKKRKASASPPRRREPVCEARLDEWNGEATDPAGTDEVLEWAGHIAGATDARSHHSYPNSHAADASSDQDLWHYQSMDSFRRPSIAAPKTTGPLTSLWRTELTKPNAIFFDMVVLLQRALASDTRAHETHISDFLDLGRAARLAVHELTAASRPCSPAQDQAYDNFSIARDRLAQRLVADAAKRDAKNAWDTEPFPNSAERQVEYLRRWLNEHMQINADMDLFDELVNVGRAAARLQDRSRRFCLVGSDDPVLREFEFARAACLAAAFYKMGGLPVMKEQTVRS